MKRKNVGHWASLFGGRKPFRAEIESAIEIGSQWTASEFQRDVILEEIPGWFPPLWGADDEWLYVRRPEGVWKTRIPKDYPSDSTIGLYQRKTNAVGETKVVGGTWMVETIVGRGGWMRGVDVDHPIDAADIDYEYSPESRGLDVEADKAVGILGDLVENGPERLVVKSNAYFEAAPSFSVEGEWLIARDRASGYTMAFPLRRDLFKEALVAGRLWLRFVDRWIEPFEVKIDI